MSTKDITKKYRKNDVTIRVGETITNRAGEKVTLIDVSSPNYYGEVDYYIEYTSEYGVSRKETYKYDELYNIINN